MRCPQCGAEVPGGARFCPACGRDVTADAAAGETPAPAAPSSEPVATPAPAPTTPMPAVPPPPPAPPSPPQGYAPPPQYAAPAYAPPPQVAAPVGPPKKKRTGLVVAIVIIAVLLLCCLVAAVGGLFIYRSQSSKAGPEANTSSATKGSDTSSTSRDDAELEAAAEVVEDYYAAIAAADMEAIGTMLAPDVADEVTADWYEGWDPTTTFEYTRGILDADTATIYGRESVQAYGSGGDGGVKFTLVKIGGEWRITAWAGADRTQIEGSDTTGSSSGERAALDEASAAKLVTDLLEARRAGDANAVRRLTTESFQAANGDVWLDGLPTAEYFTSYEITGSSVSGGSATVTVSEDWNSGTETATYVVIDQGGTLLVDSWDSRQ